MKPHGLSPAALAAGLRVLPMTVNQIVQGKRAISAEVALRLGRFFSMSPQFWFNQQSQYALGKAADAMGSELRQVSPLKAA